METMSGSPGSARPARSRIPVVQRVLGPSAVFFGLVVVLCSVGLFRAPVTEASPSAAVGLAAAWAPADWPDTDEIKTVDGKPGGKLQWDPESGRARVCDIEPDSHYVRGYVIKDGETVATMQANEKGKCDEPDSGYRLAKGEKYDFKVCLGSEKGEGYCNTSDTDKWPKADRKEDYCADNFSGAELVKCQGGDSPCELIPGGPAKDYCEQGTGESNSSDLCKKRDALPKSLTMSCEALEGLHPSGKPNAMAPPKSGPGKDINDRPEETLKLDGHAKRPAAVAEPVARLTRWLVWFALGACVFGFLLVGGNMALKHKRAEAGAHAAGLGWVMIACLVAGSGLVMGLISLLIDPL